jgi:hypothetical protein
MSIHIWDGKGTPANPDGDRLPITWRGLDFNKAFADATSGVEELPFGLFMEDARFNSPINFQSEMHPDIYKNGGGIEYYNPRVGSRVLNLRCFLRCRTQAQLGAYIDYIQTLMSPLNLQWYHTSSWPFPNGRPEWTDNWEADSLPLQFTRMMTSELNSNLEATWPDDKVLLEYNVAPLDLPDPPMVTTQQGVGARLDLSFLVLDGGRARARTVSTSTGNTQSDIIQLWGTVPSWPEITFSLDGGGAGSATFTLTVTGGAGISYTPAAIVLDLSGISGTEAIKINTRDRKVYVDNVLDMSIRTSGDWPIVPPADSSTLTYTFTNHTNVGTITTSWYEEMAS